MAKALCWAETDTERRELGERKGLDTPVVLAVNDGYWVLGDRLLGIRSLDRLNLDI